MANSIRIKRRAAGGFPGAPAGLLNAEVAFNEQDKVLYYGDGLEPGGLATQAIAIAGAGAFVTLVTPQTIDGLKTFSNNVIINGANTTVQDLIVVGGDITSNNTSFNLLINPRTIYFGTNANNISIGASTGTTTINNTLTVAGDYNVTGNTNFTGNLVIVGDLAVQGGDITSNSAIFNLLAQPTIISFGDVATTVNIGASGTGNTTIRTANTNISGILNVTGNSVLTSNVAVDGGAITSTSNVFDLIPSSYIVNFAATANNLNLGASSGTATINNPTVVGSVATQNLWNTIATTVYAFGAANTISIGAVDGNITFNNANTNVSGSLTVANAAVFTSNVIINGGALNSGTSVFDLINTTATTVNAFGAATTVNIGKSGSGNTNIISANTNISGVLNVTGNAVLSSNIAVNGGAITSTSNTFDFLATSGLVTVGASAIDVQIGSALGTTEINNNLNVVGNISLDGQYLITSNTVLNLFNTVANTVNAFGDAEVVNIGYTTGTTTIRNNQKVNGTLEVARNATLTSNIAVNGGGLTSNSAFFELIPTSTIINFGVLGETITIGNANGTTTIQNAVHLNKGLTVDGFVTLNAGVSCNNQIISNLADPLSPQDAATKAYVDAARLGLDIKDSVRVIATANIALTGLITLDNVALANNDRVLVTGQSTGFEKFNGIYEAKSGDWVRSFDANTSAKVTSGMFAYVSEGDIWATSSWVLTTKDTIDLGNTALTFVQFSSAGQTIAGDGLTKSGNAISAVGTSGRISVGVDSIDIANNYVGQNTINTVGTITTGTWKGSTVSANSGGTGFASYAVGDVLYADTTSTLQILHKGANGAFLTLNSDGTAIMWETVFDGGTF
jgi:hypothetical protein